MTRHRITKSTFLRLIPALGLAGLLAATGVGSEASATTSEMAASVEWTDANAGALQKLFPNRDGVAAFLAQVVPQTRAGQDLDFDSDVPAVMDYRFVDMNGDGKLELLARLDYSGRGVSLYLVAVYPAQGGFDAAVLNAGGRLGPLSKIVVDLANNGRKEVLDTVPLASGADEAAPVATFVHVYQFSNGSFYQADGAYTYFYRAQLLPSLQKKLWLGNQELVRMQARGAAQIVARKQAEINAIQGSIGAIKEFLHYQ
jgi:hypothetical protein